jgi:hypothetical protein
MKLTQTCLILGSLLVPSVALAQSEAESQLPDTTLAAPTLSPTHGPRLRFGAGFQMGFDVTNTGDANGAGLGVGSYLRLGVQFNDLLGVEVEGSAATALFSGYGRAALTLNVTPLDWLTFSAGPMVGANYTSVFSTSSTSYAGGTARVDFNVWHTRTARGGRQAVTLGIAGDVGVTTGMQQDGEPMYLGPGVAWGAYTMVGYSIY